MALVVVSFRSVAGRIDPTMMPFRSSFVNTHVPLGSYDERMETISKKTQRCIVTCSDHSTQHKDENESRLMITKDGSHHFLGSPLAKLERSSTWRNTALQKWRENEVSLCSARSRFHKFCSKHFQLQVRPLLHSSLFSPFDTTTSTHEE